MNNRPFNSSSTSAATAENGGASATMALVMPVICSMKTGMRVCGYARSLYPDVDFILDHLPMLETQSEAVFDNILCSAVLMHLSDADLMASCTRLVSLLAENGVLIVSFRGTGEQDNREKGKLYNPIVVEDFLKFFTDRGYAVLVNESVSDQSRGLVWHNFVIRK